MKRHQCERCRWRPAAHVLVVSTPDGGFTMRSCSTCWPQLEVAAAEVAAELEGGYTRG